MNLKKQKICVLFYLMLFSFVPLINPAITTQAKLSDNSSINFQTVDNSNVFYIYEGMINDLTAYLKESNQTDRFQTMYSGGDNYYLRYNWKDNVGGATIYQIDYPDPPSTPVKVQWLYDHGITISVKILGGQYNPLEICYNSTYKYQIIQGGINNLASLSYINLVDQIEIGDEAPATLYNWQSLPGDFNNPIYSVYNSSMHDETGLWMRTSYDTNMTAGWIAHNWIVNKTMTAMNNIYDGIKQAYPSKMVAWNYLTWSGFEPTLLKSDYYAGGYYTNDFRNFYSQVRFAKITHPGKPIYSVIMGNTDPLGQSPLTQQEQYFWTAYFAGGSEVSWFGAGNNGLWNSIGSQSILTKYELHNNLDKLANALPVLNPNPLVLQINAIDGNNVRKVTGFREFDATTQLQAESSNFSLNKYKIIVLNDQWALTDTITKKLSDYVNSGGNLILKGGLQPFGVTENASGQLRTEFLPPEIGSTLTTTQRSDSETMNFYSSLFSSQHPNMVVDGRTSLNFTSSPDWTAIPTGLPEEQSGYYPIVLYCNQTNPKSGTILYFGFNNDPTSNANIYTPILRDYVENYLHFNDLVSPSTNPDILISTSLDDGNRTIIGIIADSQSSDEFINVNVTERNLPQNNVWFYDNFNYSIWWGGVYDATGSTGTAVFETLLQPYKTQRWIFTSAYPAPEPDFRVFVKYPSADPIVGENIPLTINLYEGLQYVNLNNFNIKLTVPQGMQITSPTNTGSQKVGQLTAMSDYSFNWLVKADEPGLYKLGLSIDSDNLTRTLSYSFTIRIYESRVEISLPNIIYVTPEDGISVPGSMIYHGQNPGQIEIDDIIQDYIWGSSGGWVENITLNPGQEYFFNYTSSAKGYKAGESGVFSVYAYDKNHTTVAGNNVLIKVYPALLHSTPLISSNGQLRATIYLHGTGYINDVKAQLLVGNSIVSNSERFLGTLTTNSSFEVTWDISKLPNPSSITLLVTGNGVPSISSYYLLSGPQTFLDFIFVGFEILILVLIGSVIGAFLPTIIKNFKLKQNK